MIETIKIHSMVSMRGPLIVPIREKS
jgi:hypothetical protein